MEILFNVIALVAFLVLKQKHSLPGQHFHLYLIAYGLFRFAHEFVRANPRIIGPLSGYAIAATIMVVFGIVMFARRARQPRMANPA